MSSKSRLILKAVKPSRPSSVMSNDSDLDSMASWNDSSSAFDETLIGSQTSTTGITKRKRQRLDHLSQDEKLVRRKLKNRVAAQSARDRKKARMDELELVLEELSKERAALIASNEALAERNRALCSENDNLKVAIAATTTTIKSEFAPAGSTALDADLSGAVAFKSAELIHDRQQNAQAMASTLVLILSMVLNNLLVSVISPLMLISQKTSTSSSSSTSFCPKNSSTSSRSNRCPLSTVANSSSSCRRDLWPPRPLAPDRVLFGRTPTMVMAI